VWWNAKGFYYSYSIFFTKDYYLDKKKVGRVDKNEQRLVEIRSIALEN